MTAMTRYAFAKPALSAVVTTFAARGYAMCVGRQNRGIGVHPAGRAPAQGKRHAL